jgi:hypothetical protein
MQGADRVNDELEVGFDEKFERQWLWGQRAGRIVMAVCTAAGIAGLWGRGPLSHRTVATPGTGLKVDFEPIARSQTSTQVTLHLSNTTASANEALFIGSNTVEPMGLKQVIPAPVSTEILPDGLRMTVAIPPGTQDALIRLILMPTGIGENELAARLNDRQTLHWRQFVLP